MTKRKKQCREGWLTYKTVDNIFYAELHQAPDIQSCENMLRQSEVDRDALNAKGPWAGMLVVTGSLLVTPAVFDSTNAAAIARVNSNLKAVAWVIDPSLPGYDLLRPAFQHVYQDCCACQFFEDSDLAWAWLKQKLADAHVNTEEPALNADAYTKVA